MQWKIPLHHSGMFVFFGSRKWKNILEIILLPVPDIFLVFMEEMS